MTQDIVFEKKKNIDIVFSIDKREGVGYNKVQKHNRDYEGACVI